VQNLVANQCSLPIPPATCAPATTTTTTVPVTATTVTGF
jgi:hypothetical protein